MASISTLGSTASYTMPQVQLPKLEQVTTVAKNAFSGLDHLAIPRMGVGAFGARTTLSTASKALRGGARVGTAGASMGLGRALTGSALFAVPLALVTNFIDYKMGKIDAHQRNVLMAADSAGYVAAGAGGSMLGAALGTTFLGPGVGTVVGIGAALGLGWVYEKFIRPRFSGSASAGEPVTPDLGEYQPK